MIELKNIIKKYENNIAVNDLTLKINSGEIVGFLGPNGAGKTTTMKIISGFLTPDSGEVIIENENFQENPTNAKFKIGYMPENNPLYKDMFVFECINLALDLHNINHKETRSQRIAYVVESMGLQSVYYKTIGELSKGFKQRVGLAQAIVYDPKILILDEPTEGLDPNQRTEIRSLIKELGKDRTVMISTHVMQEVEAMCTRIIILNKGKLIKDGTKDEITKNTLGLSTINLTLKINQKFLNSINSLSNLKNTITKEINSENVIEVLNSEFLCEYKIITKNLDLTLKDISIFTAKNDIIIYMLNQEKQNLEDLFRELTLNN